MKDQMEVIKRYVLEAVSNDYEPFDLVVRDVSTWGDENGFTIDASLVLRALEELIHAGYVEAYELHAEAHGRAEPVVYSPQRATGFWFYVTPNGKQAVRDIEKEPS